MAATDPPRRRFVTKAQVEDAAASGATITLGPRDVLTDEARNRARDLGVSIARPPGLAPPATAAAAPRTPRATPATGSTQSTAELRAAIRSAVSAEVTADPAAVDAAIDRVFARRGIT